MKDAGYIAAIAAALLGLVYIGRKIGQVAVILQLLARLPDEHAQLLEATKANTEAIATLTSQMAALTSDVSRIVHS
jgi:hypothetical protein